MEGGALRRFGIEPGEGRVVAWGAACLLILGWADVSVKNVSETFFLKRVGVEELPLVFFVSMALLVPTTWAIGWLAARSDRLKLLPRVLLGLAVLLLPLWLLVLSGYTGAFGVLVIASKQLQSIALLVFWIALGDLVDGRQAKRLFAPLFAGVTLGTMLGSFASEPLSRAVGISGLLPVSAVALVCSALCALPLRRLRPPRLERAARSLASEREGAHDIANFSQLWRRSGLFRLLLVSVAASGLLGPMLYVQFQYVADLATAGEGGELKLMAFYAQFRGWISVGILATQVVATSRLYRRIGIPLASAISPLIYLLGFFGLSVRLSLPAGVGAMTGTKLQDNAVYDPALRILYNLFPEDMRSRATGLLEGPIKRGGGAIGNLVTWAAIRFGGVPWIGYIALPIAGLWLLAALALRNTYPALLLQVSARRARGEELEVADMLDPATVRALEPELIDPDPERCRVALDLVSEAPPDAAVSVLARAARAAPAATRPEIVATLDRILERNPGASAANAQAAQQLAELLETPESLSAPDRADVVQAYGRLTDGLPRQAADGWLEATLGDPAPAVRLAAISALHRRGTPPAEAPDLDAVLREALAGDDADARRTAREELRALLLCTEPGPQWEERLRVLAGLLELPAERIPAAEALADIAKRHKAAAAVIREVMLAARAAPEPRLRAAVLRYIGHAGLAEHAQWLVAHVAWDEGEGAEAVWLAARDGLRALGPRATDALLVELSFGKRSARDAIVPLLGELKVDPSTLRKLLQSELDSVRRKVVNLYALLGSVSPIVIQRLGERLDEGLHTALLLLAEIHDEDRIAELADPLKRARGGRRYAILLEVLEAFLTPIEKAELVPLLEDQVLAVRARSAARALGVPIPLADEVIAELLDDPDDLTRTLLRETLPPGFVPGDGVAAAGELLDHAPVIKPVECALMLKRIPLFEGLSTRQLMDLAGVVVEESYASGDVIVHEGEYSDCMYLIVGGWVEIVRGKEHLSRMGPSDFFGEIALFEGHRRTATVVAAETVALLRLERTSLLRLMEELPAVAISICESLSRRVREITERSSSR